MNNDVYNKLTPERKALVDMVLKNLEEGTGLWEKGWISSGVPQSVRGGKYHGVNNMVLTLVSMMRGYSDNRWVTFHQMQEKDWHFKKNEEGKSLGKGAGVTVEYYELRDKETKQSFNKNTLLGMDMDEKQEYMEENVYPIRKYYRVFNGDLIEGIPQNEVREINESERCERAENILKDWNDTESKITYGGQHAFYNLTTDEIRLPKQSDFNSLHEFYGTALHEVGHSTGHSSRLNRDMSGSFGSSDYAKEELRAEIASMFLSQDLEIEMTESKVQNNSAYIRSWKESIKDDPNILFCAIADAEKMTRFVLTKERQNVEKNVLEEESGEYKKPSEIVAKEMPKPLTNTASRVDTLNRMSDRDVVDKASKTKAGDKFETLYNGGSIFGNKGKDERSLMSRIAMFCGNDKEQLLRIFASSGQFNEGKDTEYYEKMAVGSMAFVDKIKDQYTPKTQTQTDKSFGSKNSKS